MQIYLLDMFLFVKSDNYAMHDGFPQAEFEDKMQFLNWVNSPSKSPGASNMEMGRNHSSKTSVVQLRPTIKLPE